MPSVAHSTQAPKKSKSVWTWKQEKAKYYPNGVRPYWMPKIYWAIAQCETPPGRWNHNSGTYQGAFGFYYGTWDSYKPAGYPAEAYQASAWQQYVVARNVASSVGFNAWGCYKHGGYLYHM
jgi:hypothetical protein